MRNLLALAAASVLAFVVVGWFLGWYQISSKPTQTGREYDVQFNSPKISHDLHEGEVKVQEILNNKIKQTSSQTTPASSAPPASGSTASPVPQTVTSLPPPPPVTPPPPPVPPASGPIGDPPALPK